MKFAFLGQQGRPEIQGKETVRPGGETGTASSVHHPNAAHAATNSCEEVGFHGVAQLDQRQADARPHAKLGSLGVASRSELLSKMLGIFANIDIAKVPSSGTSVLTANSKLISAIASLFAQSSRRNA